MHESVGLPLDEALRMASRYPAEAIGMGLELGCLKPGAKASTIHLSDGLEIGGVWIEGMSAAG